MSTDAETIRKFFSFGDFETEAHAKYPQYSF